MTVCFKQYLSKGDCEEIKILETFCNECDQTSLKLELDYKLNSSRDFNHSLKEINEFMYYVDDTLVSYLGISVFGRTQNCEINGMTHPDFRRKGLFTKLFNLAMQECRKRKFQKVLLLSDGKSASGVSFINSIGGSYEFSEYRMKTTNQTSFVQDQTISVREATVNDGTNITKQNELFFHFTEQWNLEEERALNKTTYMIEKNEEVIGKIAVTYSNNHAFISGFGINPIHRGKGYGTAALRETLRLLKIKNIEDVELDVETKNDAALILYKGCGFEEQLVMNYYQIIIHK